MWAVPDPTAPTTGGGTHTDRGVPSPPQIQFRQRSPSLPARTIRTKRPTQPTACPLPPSIFPSTITSTPIATTHLPCSFGRLRPPHSTKSDGVYHAAVH